MNCVICRNGVTIEGFSTVTLEREGRTFIFKNVPSRVCDNCGEEYLNEETVDDLMLVAEEDARNGVEVDIRSFHAA